MDLKFVCVYVESSSHVNIAINFLFGWLLVAFWFGLLFFFFNASELQITSLQACGWKAWKRTEVSIFGNK